MSMMIGEMIQQMGRMLVVPFYVLSSSSVVCQTLVEQDDVFLRASYCSGVLQEMYRVHSENHEPLKAAFARGFCDAWQMEGFATHDSCAEQKSFDALVGTRVKMERYAGYLETHTTKIGVARLAQSDALTAKGRNDQMSSWTRSDSRDFACSTSCRLGDLKVPDVETAKCAADCIEHYDPTQARIYRCVVLPSTLPF